MRKDPAPTGDPIVVPAAFAGEGQGAGPLFVTQRAGLFAAGGLDVRIQLLEGAKRVTAALLAGEILFGNLAAPALVAALYGEEDRP
jgi:ABC-type nitrate/sulfonate/bicarbonate transport system substrate-binding protein